MEHNHNGHLPQAIHGAISSLAKAPQAAAANIINPQMVVESIVGSVDWDSATSGYCECPGRLLAQQLRGGSSPGGGGSLCSHPRNCPCQNSNESLLPPKDKDKNLKL